MTFRLTTLCYTNWDVRSSCCNSRFTESWLMTMIVGMDKIKATFLLTPKAKERLESLKARLRRVGVPRNVANESAIVEHLIQAADRDFNRLLERFQ